MCVWLNSLITFMTSQYDCPITFKVLNENSHIIDIYVPVVMSILMRTINSFIIASLCYY